MQTHYAIRNQLVSSVHKISQEGKIFPRVKSAWSIQESLKQLPGVVEHIECEHSSVATSLQGPDLQTDDGCLALDLGCEGMEKL